MTSAGSSVSSRQRAASFSAANGDEREWPIAPELMTLLMLHAYGTCIPGELSDARRQMDADLHEFAHGMSPLVSGIDRTVAFGAAIDAIAAASVLAIEDDFAVVRLREKVVFSFVGMRVDLVHQRVLMRDKMDVVSSVVRGRLLNRDKVTARVDELMDQFELSADTTVVFNGYSRGGLRAIDCFLATAFRLPNVFVCTCNPFVWPAAVKLIQLRVGPLVRLSDRMFTARVDCDIGLGDKLPGTVRRIASRLPRTASRLDKTKAAHSLMNLLPPIADDPGSVYLFRRQTLSEIYTPVSESNALFNIVGSLGISFVTEIFD
jgi:hypothetical protein